MTTPNPHSWSGGYYGPYARNYSTYRHEHPGGTPPPAYPVQGMAGADSNTSIPSQTTRMTKDHLFALADANTACTHITALPLIGKLLGRDLQFRREASWMFDHTYLMELLTETSELVGLLENEAVVALLTVKRQEREAAERAEAEQAAKVEAEQMAKAAATEVPPEETAKEGTEIEAA